jgi:hypothetical protein
VHEVVGEYAGVVDIEELPAALLAARGSVQHDGDVAVRCYKHMDTSTPMG